MAIFDCTCIPGSGTGRRCARAGALILLLLLAATLLAAPVRAAAQVAAPAGQTTITVSIAEALELLCREMNAHVLVVGTLPAQPVTLDLARRSAEENLRSILKGHSYAVVYNDPRGAYAAFAESASGGAVPPGFDANPQMPPADEMAEPVTARKRLVARIEQLEAQIQSGEADRFHAHWSQHRDPKYIYSHDAELERLQRELAALDEPPRSR
jgi:hypothetical protein